MVAWSYLDPEPGGWPTRTADSLVSMVMVAAVVLVLGQARLTAHVELRPERDGIYLDVWTDGCRERRFLDASKAKVTVKGPGGSEAVHLMPAPNSWQRINVDRSPLAGWRTMTVVDPGIPTPVFSPSYKESIRYYLSAMDYGPQDEVLEKKWIGRQAWLLGSSVWEGDRNLCWNPQDPVTVVDIKRVAGPVLDGCGCPVWNVSNGWQNGSFLCGGSLEVTVLLPKGAWWIQLMGANVNTARSEDRANVFAPIKGHISIADWWEMDRAFRTTSPATILLKESAKVCEAFINREIVEGMPRSLVALLVGDPEPSSPIDNVWRRRVWYWSGGPINGEYSISFDANGRVKGYGLYVPPLP